MRRRYAAPPKELAASSFILKEKRWRCGDTRKTELDG
jgi:hypothetical protein